MVPGRAGSDAKARIHGVLWHFFYDTGLYPGCGGSLCTDSGYEPMSFVFMSGVDLDDDSACIVKSNAGQPEAVGKFPDKGPEPYALNDTFQNDSVSRKTLT
jgi:hypothetical protein